MGEFIVITEQMLDEARAYVPIKEKESFAGDVAMNCFDSMTIGTGGESTMPPFYKENSSLKVRYMMAALANLYFGIAFVPESENDPWRMNEAEYEAWASGNPLNQIERIKRNTRDNAVKDKCFDLLADYRALEKMLNSECYGLLKAMNDPVTRFTMLMEVQTTPEYVNALAQSLSDVSKELEDFRSSGKLQGNGG